MNSFKAHAPSHSLMILLVLLFLAAGPLLAQETLPGEPDRPYWVLLTLGKRACEEREYGIALGYFRRALEKRTPLPEAEVGIGMVYQEEGELDLAILQYEKALALRELFSVPAEYHETLYRLAEVHRIRKSPKDYEATLLRITTETPLRSDPQFIRTGESLGRIVRDRGLDKLIELYRLDFDITTRAFAELGVFYYQTGRYTQSVDHLSVAVTAILSAVIEEWRRIDPDYRFLSVASSIDEAMKTPPMNDFLLTEDLFRLLYHLGAALYAESRNLVAKDIWKSIMDRKDAGIWAAQSRRQFQRPFIEPVLNR